MLDRTAGSVLRGTAHASELAGSIVRTLDLAMDGDHRVPNRIELPSTVDDLPAQTLRAVEAAITAAAFERGWRLEGPVTVTAGAGRTVTAAFEPGPMEPWAVLVGETEIPVLHNRAVLGRSRQADVVISHPSVSRRHAVLWAQDDRILVQDLGSSNGTRVDGVAATVPTPVEEGSMLTVGAVALRVRQVRNA